MYKPTNEEFAQWIKDRDSAIAMLDVDIFRKFYKKYQDTIYQGEELTSDDRILKIKIYKMAVNSSTLFPSVKDKAAEWLIKHGYGLEI